MGDRLRASLPKRGGGDFGRLATDAKGDVDDAKASKPVRLCASWEATDFSDGLKGDDGLPMLENGETVRFGLGCGLVLVLAHAEDEGDAFFDPNMLAPDTDAKGELVDA